MRRKHAGSQAGWALITGGTSAARVEAHRLHQLLSKTLKAVESSDLKEELYAVAGDILTAMPEGLKRLEQHLDETSYALSILGQDYLKDRLDASSRARIDTAVESVAQLNRYSRIIQKARS